MLVAASGLRKAHALAHGRAPSGSRPHACAARRSPSGQDHICTGKASPRALTAAADFLDRPVSAPRQAWSMCRCHDHKGKARLKAQANPARQGRWLPRLVRKQGTRQSRRHRRWDRNFIAVFARVARARDPAFDAVQSDSVADIHEGHLSSLGRARLQHSLGRWTLQRKQRASVFRDVTSGSRCACIWAMSAPLQAALTTTKMIATIGKHQVIHDAACSLVNMP